MMISQLATVAIRARVRVSPATVPPKFVIRSKSRSRLFGQRLLELVELSLGDVRLEVGPEDQRGRRSRRAPRSRRRRAAAAAISNRDVRVGDLGLRRGP